MKVYSRIATPLISAAAVAILSVAAQAATFAPIKSPADRAMRSVLRAAQSFGQSSASGAFHVLAHTPDSDRDADQERLANLKQAIHAYFGADFSESLDLRLVTPSEKGVEEAMNALNVRGNTCDADESKVSALEAALTQAVSAPGVEVYAGHGSGNNTTGDLVGLYDVAHDQIVFFGFSNFGSED